MDDTLISRMGIEYVGFWRRVGATLIDCLIMLPFVILYMRTYKYFITNKMIIPLIIYYIITYGYQAFFVMKFGGTIGKLIMKYRIIDEQGRFLTLKNTLLRLSIYLPSIIIFFLTKFVIIDKGNLQILNIIDNVFSIFFFVDVLVIVFNKRKRAIHDYIASSYVIRKESLE